MPKSEHENEQGKRVNKIRTSLNLSLEAFGQKLGVTRAAMSNIERGQRSLTEQMATSICREYNVNYNYLMHGEGEMFSDLPKTIIDELCKQYNCDADDRSMIEEYLKLSKSSRKILKDYMRNVFENKKSVANAVRTIPDTPEELEQQYPPVGDTKTNVS